MATYDQFFLYALVVTNLLLYSLVMVGTMNIRRHPVTLAANTAEAFALLENTLKQSFPDLPSGFTWREALARIKLARPEIDWQKMEAALKDYEAYRYGGSNLTDVDAGEILRLVATLGKGARIVRRP